MPLNQTDETRLDSWLREVKELGAVVLYDPDTPDGFYLVPRQERDTDIVRRPQTGLTKRRRAD
jgi:hypothetical protein